MVKIQNINNRSNIVANSIKTLKIIHIKKNLLKKETCQRAGQQIFGFEILVYDFDFYLMLAGSFSTPGFYLVWMNTLEAKHVEF